MTRYETDIVMGMAAQYAVASAECVREGNYHEAHSFLQRADAILDVAANLSIAPGRIETLRRATQPQRESLEKWRREQESQSEATS